MSMQRLHGFTVCVRDLDKVNLVKLGYGGSVFMLKPIFVSTQAASKNDPIN